MTAATAIVREARPSDLEGIVEVDARITGAPKPAYWRGVLDRYGGRGNGCVALVVVDAEGHSVGHLFGEVRAWEFGSEPCGWVFAVGVDPAHARAGLATRLCREAIDRFRGMGVAMVRTMVRRDDVPVLAFFRSMGFVAGSFCEMETVVGEGDGEAA